MTGEAYPVRKQSGDEVFAGTIVLDGTIYIRTTKPADDSLIANIIKLVEEAQMGKAPIQRLVDRISAVFVPIVSTSCHNIWNILGVNRAHVGR